MLERDARAPPVSAAEALFSAHQLDGRFGALLPVGAPAPRPKRRPLCAADCPLDSQSDGRDERANRQPGEASEVRVSRASLTAEKSRNKRRAGEQPCRARS